MAGKQIAALAIAALLAACATATPTKTSFLPPGGYYEAQPKPEGPVIAPRNAGIVGSIDPARIDATLKGFIDRGDLVGVSALVDKNNSQVYFGAFGMADRENHVPMARDTRVQIWSMTKPITGTALMILYDEGKFKLSDPITKYLPEFAHVKVWAGMDANGKPILVDPVRPITVLDIMRHTAGWFNGDSGIPALDALYKKVDPTNNRNTLDEEAKLLASVPLAYQPGEKWHYSPAPDMQALMVQRLSGMPFDQFLQTHIFGPLKMTHTTRFVPDKSMLAAEYDLHKNGGPTRVPDDRAYETNTHHWPLQRGSAGLTSTLDDYMRFARMLLNYGKLDGVRILKRSTVRLMSTNWLPAGITDREWLPSKGNVGFGLDFAVRTAPPDPGQAAGEMNEFFWDGAAGTLFWVDPLNKITAVLFVQYFGHSPLHKDFRNAVYGITP